MKFNIKNTKYTIAIFAVFAISGLLYTSSALQNGFAQSNPSSGSGGGSLAQSNSGSPTTGGQKNEIGTAAQMHNLTGAGTQQILSNNTSISNPNAGKVSNENKAPAPSQGKPTPKSQPFPTPSQAAGQSGNQSLTGQNVGQSKSSGSGAQSQGNQSSSGGQSKSSGSGAPSQGNQSGGPLGFLSNLLGGKK